MQELNLITGKAGSRFAGRYFVRPEPHQKLVRLELRLLGASYKGTAYLLPADVSERALQRLNRAAGFDEAARRGEGLQEHRARCEEVEIAQLKLAASRKGIQAQQAALAAAKARLQALSPAERELMARIIAEKVAEADRFRTLIAAGTVQAGDEIHADGIGRTVEALGPAWKVTAGELPRLKARFPDAEALMPGDMVQYAFWPEAEEDAAHEMVAA